MPRKTKSQYFTKMETWKPLIDALKETIDISSMKVIDPCAGDGRMISKFFPDGEAFDIEPQTYIAGPGEPKPIIVKKCDMMTIDYSQFEGLVAVVTNMPFNASDNPNEKLDHIMKQPNVCSIATINATKYEYYHKDSHKGGAFGLNPYFHLARCVEVSNGYFSAPVTAELSFQIWVRRDYPRVIPETIFKACLGSHISDEKFTFVYEVQSLSKAQLSENGGKGRKVKLPYRRMKRIPKSTPGKTKFYMFLNERAKNMDIMTVEKILGQIIRHSNIKFHHGSQGFGPGHTIRTQVELKLTV